jgi:hypothetical protein
MSFSSLLEREAGRSHTRPGNRLVEKWIRSTGAAP